MFTDSMIDSTQFLHTSSGYASRTGSSSESQSDGCSDFKYERNNLSLPSESLTSLLTDPYSYCDPVPGSTQQHQHHAPSVMNHHPAHHQHHNNHHNHHQHHYHHHASGLIDQSQAQTILKKKHSLLQAHIHQQQEQLRRMEEELFNSQFNDQNSHQQHVHNGSNSSGDRMQEVVEESIDQSSNQSATVGASSIQSVTQQSSYLSQHHHQQQDQDLQQELLHHQLSSSPGVEPDFVRRFIQLTSNSKSPTHEMDHNEYDLLHHHRELHPVIEGQTIMCEPMTEQMPQIFTWHTGAV